MRGYAVIDKNGKDTDVAAASSVHQSLRSH